jgi:L-seryl-tRNA(Ser) seleniumtransferase
MKSKTNVEPIHLPQVDKVLRQAPLSYANISQGILVKLVRLELSRLKEIGEIPSIEEIAGKVAAKARELSEPKLKPVINGTGVICNTNLGRAPWAQTVVNNSINVVSGYASLETDLLSGKRGKRLARVEELLQLLTGCEAAIVVNNNAAAVLLAVNTLANGKEVIVSRGELVEIGGSFRLPDVIAAAGGILAEVGTTNRTRIADYKNKVNDETAILFKCHRSNFAIVGFTEQTSLAELAGLSSQTKIPLVEDLGSGALLTRDFPDHKQETVEDIVAGGADLVCFSGDKLLGGPQAGIIAGKKALIDRLHKNPLYRALRPDKLIISALEAQLTLYLTPEASKEIPTLNMMRASSASVKARVEAFIACAGKHLSHFDLSLIKTESTTGGGSMPSAIIESYGVALQANCPANKITQWLRSATTPVIAMTNNDQVLLDFRTIFASEENTLLDVLIYIESKHLSQPTKPCNDLNKI